MPLMKYFVFVGSALVLLLLAMNWPQPNNSNSPLISMATLCTDRPPLSAIVARLQP